MAFIRYVPKRYPIDYRKDFMEQFRANEAELKRCDDAAREDGEIVGRYIDEPIADGKAIYQIIRQGKKSVRIAHCVGFGDDWTVPYWGYEATIDLSYALNKLAWRDNPTAFMERKQK